MKWRYTGDAIATYPAYLDTGTGCTLVAEPGGTYEIAPAEGGEQLPVPPAGPWERVKSSSPSKDKE